MALAIDCLLADAELEPKLITTCLKQRGTAGGAARPPKTRAGESQGVPPTLRP